MLQQGSVSFLLDLKLEEGNSRSCWPPSCDQRGRAKLRMSSTGRKEAERERERNQVLIILYNLVSKSIPFLVEQLGSSLFKIGMGRILTNWIDNIYTANMKI